MKSVHLRILESLEAYATDLLVAGDAENARDYYNYAYNVLADIEEYESGRKHFSFARAHVPRVENAPWSIIKMSGSDDALIHFLGFNLATFMQLVHGMQAYFPPRYSGKRGRPPVMDAEDVTALVLHYLHTSCGHKTLQMIFGVVNTAKYVKLGLEAMAKVLAGIPDAAVMWPNSDTISAWVQAIRRDDCPLDTMKPFGFVDGLALRIQQPASVEEQRQYYSGYHRGTVVNNILAFGPDGTIFYAKSNIKGSIPDSRCADRLYEMLRDEKLNPDRAGVLADAAFCRADLGMLVMTPMKAGMALSKMEKARSRQYRVHCWTVGRRQAAEWGMGGVQRAFPRLTVPLSNNSERRKVLLRTVYKLFNLRSRRVGLNQIRTVYEDAFSTLQWELQRPDRDVDNESDDDHPDDTET